MKRTRFLFVSSMAVVACSTPAPNSNLGVPVPSKIDAPAATVLGPNGAPTTVPVASGTPGAVVAAIAAPDIVVAGDRFVVSGLGSTFGGGTPSFAWSLDKTNVIDFCDGTNGPKQSVPELCAKVKGDATVTLTAGNGSATKTASFKITVDDRAQIVARGTATAIDGGTISVSGYAVSTAAAAKPAVPAALGPVLTLTDADGNSTLNARDVCLLTQGIADPAPCYAENTPANWKSVAIAGNGSEIVNLDLGAFEDPTGQPLFREVRFTGASASRPSISVSNVARVVAEKPLNSAGSVNLVATLPPSGDSGGGLFLQQVTAATDVTLTTNQVIVTEGAISAATIDMTNTGEVATYIGNDLVVSGVASHISISSDDAPVYFPRTRLFDTSGVSSTTGGNGGDMDFFAAGILNLSNAQLTSNGGSVSAGSPDTAVAGSAGSIALAANDAVVVGSNAGTVISAMGGNGKGTVGQGGKVTISNSVGDTNPTRHFTVFAGNIVTTGGANLLTDRSSSGANGDDIAIYAHAIDVKGSLNSSGGNGNYAPAGSAGPTVSSPGKILLSARAAGTTDTSIKIDGSVIARPGRGVGGTCNASTPVIDIDLGVNAGRHELLVTGALNTSGGYDSAANAENKAQIPSLPVGPANNLLGATAAGEISVLVGPTNGGPSAGPTTVSLKDVLARGGAGDGGGGGCPVTIQTDVSTLTFNVSGAIDSSGGEASRIGGAGSARKVSLSLQGRQSAVVRLPNGLVANGGHQVSASASMGGSGGNGAAIALSVYAVNIDATVGDLLARGGNTFVTDASPSAGAGGSVTAVLGSGSAKNQVTKLGKIDISGGAGLANSAAAAAASAGGPASGTIQVNVAGSTTAHVETTVGDLLANGGASALSTNNPTNTAAPGGSAGSVTIDIGGTKIDGTNKFAFGHVAAKGAAGVAVGSGSAAGGLAGAFSFSAARDLVGQVTIGGIETTGGAGAGGSSTNNRDGGNQSFDIVTPLSINTGALVATGGSASVPGGKITHSGPITQIAITCSSVSIGTVAGACIDTEFSCHGTNPDCP